MIFTGIVTSPDSLKVKGLGVYGRLAGETCSTPDGRQIPAARLRIRSDKLFMVSCFDFCLMLVFGICRRMS